MSRATADLVGLAAKGRIEVGADADLVGATTPAGTTDVDVARLAHRNPISAYDGLAFAGRVTTHRRARQRRPRRPEHGPDPLVRRAASCDRMDRG